MAEHGHDDHAPKKGSSIIVIAILAVFVVLAVLVFFGARGDDEKSKPQKATTTSAQVATGTSPPQQRYERVQTISTECPSPATLTIPGANNTDQWSVSVKPGDCDVIFMDNPSTIKRRYRYFGGEWSEDQHEKRVGFDEAQYQNTAAESVDMRIKFRPGS
jgi:hypothetical protein